MARGKTNKTKLGIATYAEQALPPRRVLRNSSSNNVGRIPLRRMGPPSRTCKIPLKVPRQRSPLPGAFVCQHRLDPANSWPRSAKLGPMLTKLGQRRPDLGQHWQTRGQIRPNLAAALRKFLQDMLPDVMFAHFGGSFAVSVGRPFRWRRLRRASCGLCVSRRLPRAAGVFVQHSSCILQGGQVGGS